MSSNHPESDDRNASPPSPWAPSTRSMASLLEFARSVGDSNYHQPYSLPHIDHEEPSNKPVSPSSSSPRSSSSTSDRSMASFLECVRSGRPYPPLQNIAYDHAESSNRPVSLSSASRRLSSLSASYHGTMASFLERIVAAGDNHEPRSYLQSPIRTNNDDDNDSQVILYSTRLTAELRRFEADTMLMDYIVDKYGMECFEELLISWHRVRGVEYYTPLPFSSLRRRILEGAVSRRKERERQRRLRGGRFSWCIVG